MNVLVIQPLSRDRLNSFRFRLLLRGETAPIEHVEKIGIPSGVELVGAFQLDAALLEEIGEHPVGDGRPKLGLNVIANKGKGLLVETLGPGWIAGNEHRDAIDESDPSF